jgi:hypothetical protein
MNKIEFRRNHTLAARGSTINKRAILMVFVFFVFLFTLLYLSGNLSFNENKKSTLNIYFYSNNQIIVQQDTTNYDNFASVLKQKIINLKQESIEIRMYLAPNLKVREMSDIVQISNAFKGINVKYFTLKS